VINGALVARRLELAGGGPAVWYDASLGGCMVRVPRGAACDGALLPLELWWFDASWVQVYRPASAIVYAHDAFQTTRAEAVETAGLKGPAPRAVEDRKRAGEGRSCWHATTPVDQWPPLASASGESGPGARTTLLPNGHGAAPVGGAPALLPGDAVPMAVGSDADLGMIGVVLLVAAC